MLTAHHHQRLIIFIIGIRLFGYDDSYDDYDDDDDFIHSLIVLIMSDSHDLSTNLSVNLTTVTDCCEQTT